MELKRLEMDMMLLLLGDSIYTITEDYSISLLGENLVVTLRKKDITVNLDKIIVFQPIRRINNSYIFRVRAEYLRFDNHKHIKESYLYRRLYGYYMDTNYKRLLIFLGSLNRKELPRYISLIPTVIMESIKKFFESDSYGAK